MKCVDFAGAFGLTCEQIKDDLTYLQTPMVDTFGGRMFGFYAQDLSHDRIRLSDNADTLFSAMCAGVRPSNRRGISLAEAAEQRGVTLSDDGELHLTFPRKDLGFYVARFIEAMLSISASCENWLPVERKASTFEKHIRKELKKAFPGQVKTDYEMTGASGNQLRFNFAIAPETDHGRLIQIIPARPHGDRHYWPSVYSIAGKMMDVRNIRPNLGRFVIIENSETIETARAGTVIAECASVIQYSCEGNLRQQLMAS